MLVLLSAGCGETVRSPVPEAIDPTTTVVGVEVAVTISGRNFHPAVHVDFRHADSNQVLSVYSASVGGLPLLAVERVDTGTITAVVPGTLAVGTHDLLVTSAANNSGLLPGAFTVWSNEDTDGDGVPDGLDQCPGFDDRLDADNDGAADGCDLCPGFDDAIDTDGDGTPDGCETCPTDWHSCAWSYRIELTVRTGQVASPQVGFPIYLDLALLGAAFFTTTNGDGSDIVVTAADGVTALPRELEVFDQGTNSGALWFGAPSLQDGTRFYVYFGNASAGEMDSTAVWDSSFLGVWHNSVDPSGPSPQVTDSTANAIHGDVVGGMPAVAQVSGKVGNCLDFNGTDQYVVLEGTSGVLDHTGSGAGMQMTICAWVNPDGLTSSFPSIISKGDTQYHLKLHSTDRWEFKSGGQYHLSDDPISAPFTQWYHVCGVNDGTNNISYVNGILQADSTTPAAIVHDDYPVWMGLDSQNTGRDPFDGFIDELKFSNTVRDANWIGAEFNNQNDPAAFFAVGLVETP